MEQGSWSERFAAAEKRPLSEQQLTGIGLLLTGATDQAVAERVGVQRHTVTRWRLYHPLFRAELLRRRREAWAGASDALGTIIPMALDTLRDQLRVGMNRGRLAVDRLYKMGLTGAPRSAVALGDGSVAPADDEEALREILDEEVRKRRAVMAAEDPDDPQLVKVDAPVTAEEREVAMGYLMGLGGEGS